MNQRDEFFSSKHKQLLNIAATAKLIAWIALGIAIVLPIASFLGTRNLYQSMLLMNGQSPDFLNDLKTNPAYAISVFVDILDSFLRGFVYFLVLRGISLGLSMIVETDINYREKTQEG